MLGGRKESGGVGKEREKDVEIIKERWERRGEGRNTKVDEEEMREVVEEQE